MWGFIFLNNKEGYKVAGRCSRVFPKSFQCCIFRTLVTCLVPFTVLLKVEGIDGILIKTGLLLDFWMFSSAPVGLFSCLMEF